MNASRYRPLLALTTITALAALILSLRADPEPAQESPTAVSTDPVEPSQTITIAAEESAPESATKSLTDDQMLRKLTRESKGELFGWAIARKDLTLAKKLIELGPVTTPTLEQLVMLIVKGRRQDAPLLKLVVEHTEFVRLYCNGNLSDEFPEFYLKSSFSDPSRLNSKFRTTLDDAGCLKGAKTLAQALAELVDKPLKNDLDSVTRLKDLLVLGLAWDQADALAAIFDDALRQRLWVEYTRSQIGSQGLKEQDYEELIPRIGDINALYNEHLSYWLLISMFIDDAQYLPFFEKLISSGVTLPEDYKGDNWQRFFDHAEGERAEIKQAQKSMIEKAWIQND